MLNDINKWSSLNKLKSCNPVLINGKKAFNHSSTIKKKFNKQSEDSIFKFAFQKCINLSIDSSFINNKYGIEDIGLNTHNKKKIF